jgi:hypothetical protein
MFEEMKTKRQIIATMKAKLDKLSFGAFRNINGVNTRKNTSSPINPE